MEVRRYRLFLLFILKTLFLGSFETYDLNEVRYSQLFEQMKLCENPGSRSLFDLDKNHFHIKFKIGFLINHSTNQIQTSCGSSLRRKKQILYKRSMSQAQDGRHTHIW